MQTATITQLKDYIVDQIKEMQNSSFVYQIIDETTYSSNLYSVISNSDLYPEFAQDVKYGYWPLLNTTFPNGKKTKSGYIAWKFPLSDKAGVIRCIDNFNNEQQKDTTNDDEEFFYIITAHHK